MIANNNSNQQNHKKTLLIMLQYSIYGIMILFVLLIILSDYLESIILSISCYIDRFVHY